jgi:hypothetical protein
MSGEDAPRPCLENLIVLRNKNKQTMTDSGNADDSGRMHVADKLKLTIVIPKFLIMSTRDHAHCRRSN